VPVAGEAIAGEIFDGETEAAIFPGDLPDDPNELLRSDKDSFRGLAASHPQNADFRFLRVRPPVLELTEHGVAALPHIRLDRALQFLIGDQLV
jgi:predicted YcjX-like family ATPase